MMKQWTLTTYYLLFCVRWFDSRSLTSVVILIFLMRFRITYVFIHINIIRPKLIIQCLIRVNVRVIMHICQRNNQTFITCIAPSISNIYVLNPVLLLPKYFTQGSAM
eukprot:842195_1